MKASLIRIYKKLLSTYGYQGWWPIVSMAKRDGFDSRGYHPKLYGYPETEQQRLEITLGAILTQNTAWKNVELCLLNIINQGLLDREKLLKLPLARLAEIIKSSGYYNQKAKKVRAFLSFRGKPTRENLLKIWGLGDETVDSILLYAHHKPYFVVDAYTKRILKRLGLLGASASYSKVQELFHKELPRRHELYNEFHALLVEHAKRYCRKKPLCRNCHLSEMCKQAF